MTKMAMRFIGEMKRNWRKRLDEGTSNKIAFLQGSIITLIIVSTILAYSWVLVIHPWLNGIAYNMQLDESVLKHFGIIPTSNYQLMWDQVTRLPILTGQ
jgi:hypothetical protein